MGKVIKIVAILVLAVVLLVGGGIGYLSATANFTHPDTPKPAIKASNDPEVIKRGEYLVHNVAHCSTCHQPGDNLKQMKIDLSAPLVGGYRWEIGPFGNFTAKNLTPHETGIGSRTDEELARTIRHGIGSNGNFYPMMALSVGPMADQDLIAVISYLRAQKPVEGARAEPEYGFLAKLLASKFGPNMKEAPRFVPEGGISVERGAYLANGPAMCKGCHTPADPMEGFAFSGPPFSGVTEADPDHADPNYVIAVPNLTPDPKTGHIVSWSEDDFVKRFKAGRAIKGSKMPWEAFSGMTDEDLRSLYRYLQTVEPAVNDIGEIRRKS